MLIGLLAIVELAGPVVAERKDGGTPWHAHHMVERLALFAIIALGEGVVGTVAALSAVVEQQGWTLDAALVGIAGTGLTFGLWWVFYILPSAEVLHTHRDRSFVWGYSQLVLVTAIVATGAGLHITAYFIEHKAHISPLATVLTVAVPVGVFLGLIYGALLLPRSTIRSVGGVAADGDGGSRRGRGCRSAVRNQHRRLPGHPHACASRHRRRL